MSRPIIQSTSRPPDGTAGTPYSFQLEASGTATITWALAAGLLPPGLTLSTAGEISGTPLNPATWAADFEFTVEAQNGDGTDIKTIYLVVTGTSSATTGHPSARYDHRLVYTPSRGIVAFGGAMNEGGGLAPTVGAPYPQDTWQYNGSWTKTMSVPSARVETQLVYVPGRQVHVMMGGSDGGLNDELDSTWELGADKIWRLIPTTSTPPFYNNPVLAHHNGYVYALPSNGGGTDIHLWRYDGIDWDDLGAMNVSGGFGRSFKLLGTPGGLYLFASGYFAATDMWKYSSGTTFTQVWPATWPSPNLEHPSPDEADTQPQPPNWNFGPSSIQGFDTWFWSPQRGRIVIAGISDNGGTFGPRTFEWDPSLEATPTLKGLGWKQGNDFVAGQTFGPAVFDTGRNQGVLAGTGIGAYGGSSTIDTTTYTWGDPYYGGQGWVSGQTNIPVGAWTSPSYGSGPSSRTGNMLSFDTGTGELILFGGYSGLAWFNDTWVLSPQGAWSQTPTANAPGQVVFFAMARGPGNTIVAFGGHGQTSGNETWVLSTTGWTRKYPAASPPARNECSMAYDSIRQKTILCGGTAVAQGALDTWEWDGTNWSEVTPYNPAARDFVSMAYDPSRNITVMYGGTGNSPRNDTCIFNGTQWVKVTPANNPGYRFGHSMAYDPGLGKIVLFGGFVGDSNSVSPRNDTWVWDGTNWAEIVTPTQPSARGHAGMAYHSGGAMMLLFGGNDNGYPPYGTKLGDTWSFDGTDWSSVSSSASPSARAAMGMTWDAYMGRVLLFGGLTADGNSAETWAFDAAIGTGWGQQFPVDSPSARNLFGMTHDGGRQKTVIFSDSTWEWGLQGQAYNWINVTPTASPPSRSSGPGLVYDSFTDKIILFDGDGWSKDTWLYEGTTWSQVGPRPIPTDRYGMMFAFDLSREVSVLFGGHIQGGASQETWEWDGVDWLQRQPVNSPPIRAYGDMAYDDYTGKITLFGGNNNLWCPDLAKQDTWEYNGTNWVEKLPEHSPPVRFAFGMDYHPGIQGIVLFGGHSVERGVYLDDTWTWNGVDWSPIRITTSSLPSAMSEVDYLTYIVASGNTPIIWTVISIPDWLTLTPYGKLLGAPPIVETVTSYTVSVGARNPWGTDSKTFSLLVYPYLAAPVITSSSLPTGTSGIAYSVQIQATGSTPIIWGTNSTLPVGLSLSTSGLLEGTPIDEGEGSETFPLSISAQNTEGTDTRALSLTIIRSAPSGIPVITTATLSNGEQYIPYSLQLEATGDPTIVWTIQGGTLPTGMSLTVGGLLAGTPTTFGTTSLQIGATNSLGADQATLSLTLAQGTPPIPPTITSISPLPQTREGHIFLFTLEATGTPTISWTIATGNLPDGILLTSGQIVGTATEYGSFIFTVRADNAFGNDQKQLTLQVLPEIPIPSTVSLSSTEILGVGVTGVVEAPDGVRTRFRTPLPFASLQDGTALLLAFKNGMLLTRTQNPAILDGFMTDGNQTLVLNTPPEGATRDLLAGGDEIQTVFIRSGSPNLNLVGLQIPLSNTSTLTLPSRYSGALILVALNGIMLEIGNELILLPPDRIKVVSLWTPGDIIDVVYVEV